MQENGVKQETASEMKFQMAVLKKKAEDILCEQEYQKKSSLT
jgi:hypothetical protein